MITADESSAGEDAPTEEWCREPQQGRSQETLDAFLDSIEALLAERSYDEISVSEIVARSGRTIGSFYARFRDKDAALFTLHSRHLESETAAGTALLDPGAWDGIEPGDCVRAVVEALIVSYRHPRASFRAAVVRSADAPELLAACRAASQAFARSWRCLVRRRIDDGAVGDAGRAADRSLRYLLGALNQDLLYGELILDDPLSDEELAAELTEGCLAMLGVDAGGDPR